MPATLLFLLCSVAAARVIDFEAAGAVAGDDSSTKVARNNSAVLSGVLSALRPGDILVVPNKTFLVMGGVLVSGLDSVTLQLDGTLKWSDDIDAWPKDGEMPLTALTLQNSRRLLLTSSGTGTLDGNGGKWWGIPGIGYLTRGKNRPPLLSIDNATDFVIEHWSFLNSPRFNFISSKLRNATIRYCSVSARRTSQDSHGSIDLTAFNTDGFDVSGTDIHIHDCNVWNQDDCVAIKTEGEDTQNVLVERVQASGVGLSIGSIGAHAVRNITFRDCSMYHTYKGIYIKFRSSGARGSITNILYENIFMDKPESWPIWIGPAQQDIKESGSYNPCHGDPCSLCWPTLKSANCDAPAGLLANITLRNITIKKPKLSPGVIYGNATNPIQGLVFDGVKVIDPPGDGAWGKDYFFCEGVGSGVAMGGTWPVPPCFRSSTSTAATGHQTRSAVDLWRRLHALKQRHRRRL